MKLIKEKIEFYLNDNKVGENYIHEFNSSEGREIIAKESGVKEWDSWSILTIHYEANEISREYRLEHIDRYTHKPKNL